MQLTKNFHLEEFRCKDGHLPPAQYMDNIKELAENLQVLRDFIGKPIKINSGYRTPQYNKEIGGVKNSQHIYGRAADFYIFGMSTQQILICIEQLVRAGRMKAGGVGIYDTFVHYDIRSYKSRWDFRKYK